MMRMNNGLLWTLLKQSKWLLGTNSPYNHEGKRSYCTCVTEAVGESERISMLLGRQVSCCLRCAGEVMQGQSPPPGRG